MLFKYTLFTPNRLPVIRKLTRHLFFTEMECSPDFDACMSEAAYIRQTNPLVRISPAENHVLLLLVPEEQHSLCMAPEVILSRWVEYHLHRVDSNMSVKNFTTDWRVSAPTP